MILDAIEILHPLGVVLATVLFGAIIGTGLAFQIHERR